MKTEGDPFDERMPGQSNRESQRLRSGIVKTEYDSADEILPPPRSSVHGHAKHHDFLRPNKQTETKKTETKRTGSRVQLTQEQERRRLREPTPRKLANPQLPRLSYKEAIMPCADGSTPKDQEWLKRCVRCGYLRTKNHFNCEQCARRCQHCKTFDHIGLECPGHGQSDGWHERALWSHWGRNNYQWHYCQGEDRDDHSEADCDVGAEDKEAEAEQPQIYQATPQKGRKNDRSRSPMIIRNFSSQNGRESSHTRQRSLSPRRERERPQRPSATQSQLLEVRGYESTHARTPRDARGYQTYLEKPTSYSLTGMANKHTERSAFDYASPAQNTAERGTMPPPVARHSRPVTEMPDLRNRLPPPMPTPTATSTNLVNVQMTTEQAARWYSEQAGMKRKSREEIEEEDREVEIQRLLHLSSAFKMEQEKKRRRFE